MHAHTPDYLVLQCVLSEYLLKAQNVFEPPNETTRPRLQDAGAFRVPEVAPTAMLVGGGAV